ncbi:protein of unknown function [Salegentibacter agarivorans]|uniref:Chromosome segregation protein n=1 Tax=Salegentibacter agarivorans TaxID=345907 RepID=A0A1I2L0N0_9FLAO|nr:MULTISPECIES: DUF349 domain-containing protein [Salegentibacter]MBO2545833.1 DUF349 domain-containing protein [Salegentibacter sp. BDJ18]SFF72089.1 protein of unknown function [Salegentibacter agarivorans]
MSQQENDKNKEEFSNESTNNSEQTQDKKKLSEENNDANAEENSFSQKSETQKTSEEKNAVIEPAETASEIKSKDDSLEDAMIAEAGDTKNTSEENKASKEEDDEDDAILEESRKKKRPEEEKDQVETGAKAEEKSGEAHSDDDDDDDDEDDETSEEDGRTSKHHQEHIDDSVAEDSEDETKAERHDIPKKDYHAMSKEQLADEFESLLKKEKVQAIKDHVIEIRAEFNAKFNEEEEEKKEEFLAEGGNIIDFHYSTPLKKRFNSLYFDYREKRNNYYKQLKQDLNKNLAKRLEIIEELKGLIDVEENINTTYKHFKELQDRWRVAGPIPREKYNDVWNTYHHHVENFYDFLHLNREFRDLDFKHNLDQKLKVIDRAEELVQENDVNRAFRELQMLHKMWKEELGPVAKEFREDIWERFSSATKQIHDKRQEFFSTMDERYEENWKAKQVIIEKIREIADEEYKSHNKWQQKIKEIEALREAFFNAGKVPRSKNEETWTDFKQTVRRFNRNKNAFYKNLKKQQYDNLEKKKELIKIAEENKDSDDFKTVTPLMKKIQADWKKIGHVPRKDSDKVWKQFKAACNHYFERMHENRDDENKEEFEAFDKKKELLEQVKSVELTGDKKEDLPKIKQFIEDWKNLGKVPHNKRFIEGKFNKALDQLFNKLDVDHTKAEMLKYENKVQAINDADDDKKLRNEHYFLTKKIEETKAEIRQLENNLQFFSNVDDDNPLVQDVHKNIADQKEQLEVWKEKLRKIKSLY